MANQYQVGHLLNRIDYMISSKFINYILCIFIVVISGCIFYQNSIIKRIDNTLSFYVDNTTMDYKNVIKNHSTLATLISYPKFELNGVINNFLVSGLIDGRENLEFTNLITKNKNLKHHIFIENGWTKYCNVMIPYEDGKLLLNLKCNREERNYILCDYDDKKFTIPEGDGYLFFDYLYISPKASSSDKFLIPMNAYESNVTEFPNHIIVVRKL